MENNFNGFSQQKKKKGRNIQLTHLFSEYKTSSRNIKYGKCQPWCLKIESRSRRILIVRHLKNGVFGRSLCFCISSPCPASFKSKTRVDFKYPVPLIILLHTKNPKRQPQRFVFKKWELTTYLYFVSFTQDLTGLLVVSLSFPFKGKLNWMKGNEMKVMDY